MTTALQAESACTHPGTSIRTAVIDLTTHDFTLPCDIGRHGNNYKCARPAAFTIRRHDCRTDTGWQDLIVCTLHVDLTLCVPLLCPACERHLPGYVVSVCAL